MKAIDILVKEHDSILSMIEIIRKIFTGSEDKTAINIGHVEMVVDFIRNFADKYHHLKEEDVLFAEMEKYGMPREGGPIGVMLMEHDEGRAYVRNTIEAIERFKNGDLSALAEMENNLMNYGLLLTNHIHKENHILYPMAEKFLPIDVLKTIGEDFEKANSETIDNEYFDKYLKIAEDLGKIYL